MNKRALTVLVVSLSMAFSPMAVHAQNENFTETASDASLVTYNDAANCSDAQSIVTAAQSAANERIRDVNGVVSKIGAETRTRRACIENLMKMLTLSIPSFPSLTSIVNQLVTAFIQNLIGKACSAATGAINGAISQVNTQINAAQNGVTNITSPLTAFNRQAASIANDVLPNPAQIVREEISGAVVGPGPVGTFGPGPVNPNAGAVAPAAEAKATGWKSVSCLIFGGCK